MNENECAGFAEQMELFKQTPASVWRGYFDNGYTWAEAVLEEFSCNY